MSDASKKLEPLLGQRQLVYVVDGPVEASGYTWYEVAPLGDANTTVELPFGWIAAADKDGTPWITKANFRCPDKPTTVEDLADLNGIVGLYCFGGSRFTVFGRIADPEATCGIDIGWTVDPEWLAGTCPQPKFLLEPSLGTGQPMNAIVDPALNVSAFRPGPEPADWLPVKITGRFDHVASDSCHGVSTGTPVPYSEHQIVLGCRATFVITGLKLG